MLSQFFEWPAVGPTAVQAVGAHTGPAILFVAAAFHSDDDSAPVDESTSDLAVSVRSLRRHAYVLRQSVHADLENSLYTTKKTEAIALYARTNSAGLTQERQHDSWQLCGNLPEPQWQRVIDISFAKFISKE